MYNNYESHDSKTIKTWEILQASIWIYDMTIEYTPSVNQYFSTCKFVNLVRKDMDDRSVCISEYHIYLYQFILTLCFQKKNKWNNNI